MTLPSNIRDRDHRSFTLCGDKVARRVCVAIDINSILSSLLCCITKDLDYDNIVLSTVGNTTFIEFFNDGDTVKIIEINNETGNIKIIDGVPLNAILGEGGEALRTESGQILLTES
jgi:hypothetical protein